MSDLNFRKRRSGLRLNASFYRDSYTKLNDYAGGILRGTGSGTHLKKCRLRINQAVRDGCLEQYLADFLAAVKKAQQTAFLHGEGARGWRAGFNWFIANNLNIYAVIEGK